MNEVVGVSFGSWKERGVKEVSVGVFLSFYGFLFMGRFEGKGGGEKVVPGDV